MTLSEFVPGYNLQHGMTCVAVYSLLLLLALVVPSPQMPSSSHDVCLGKQNLIKYAVHIDTFFQQLQRRCDSVSSDVCPL